jgi:hypothetical protein
MGCSQRHHSPFRRAPVLSVPDRESRQAFGGSGLIGGWLALLFGAWDYLPWLTSPAVSGEYRREVRRP